MLKQTLLAFTVLGLAGSAAAADITNPFFLPEAMHVASVTSAEFDRTQYKAEYETAFSNVRDYTRSVTEQLQFGILNNLALTGSVTKEWYKAAGHGFDGVDEYTITGKGHNDLDWTAGFAWNILHCNTKLQLAATYGQITPSYKYIDTEVKFGYQFKTFLPYVTVRAHSPVAQTEEGRVGKWSYDGKVGVYQGKCGVWSLDTGLRLAFDRTDHERDLTAEAEASYYLTKNMTLGVYGSYLLDIHHKDFEGKDHVRDKAVGARLRLYF